MPAIDEVSQALGELKSICSDTKDAVQIIRSDQVSMRREIDWLKSSVTNLKQYEPDMKDVQSVKKAGSATVKVVGYLGGAGLLGTIIAWIRTHLH